MPSQSPRRLRLAAAAVLGVSGLGVLPLAATAAPASSGFGPSTTAILSPSAARYTVGNDGTDSTVRLEAGGGSTVSQVRFEFRTNDTSSNPLTPGTTTSAWTPIATVSRNDDGAFATEWAGAGSPSGFLVTRTVDVRAVPLDATGSPVAGGVTGERIGLVESTTDRGVNITNGTDLGYFQQPYAAPDNRKLVSLSGTTGPLDSGGSAQERARTLRLGFFVDGDTRSQDAHDPLPGVPAGAFTQTVSIDGYEIETGANPVNQIVMWAELENPNGTPAVQADETESFALYRQTITTVTATADRTNVAPGEQARVSVEVLDQSGKPIVGAEVRPLSGTPAVTGDPKYTDETGRTEFLQSPGTARYFANATNTAAFSAVDGDKQSAAITVEAYQAVTTSLTAASADGTAFDLDEVDNASSTGVGNDGDATDVTVQVKDQRGNDVTPGSSQRLEYHWVVTPFSGGATTRFPVTGSSTGTAEGGGRFSIVVPSGGNGTYELFAGLTGDTISSTGTIASSRVLTVRAGQAAIAWDVATPQELPAGSTSQVSGRLGLPDGTLLPGRALALTFQRDTTTTGEDLTPDAGFTSGGGTTLTTTVTTSPSGTFAVSVTDPAETPQLDELGDNIDAASAPNSFGNAGATRNDQVVNFVKDDVPTAVVLTESREASTLRPGEFTLYTARVVNRLGGGVAGQDVVLTTNAGYFSLDDGNAATTSPTPAPAPATGQDAGTYRNDGQTVTLETRADGTATVFLAMGRDSGFDDDGQVVSTVSAAAGSFDDDDTHTWDSSNPLNGGAVEVVESDREQDSAILPRAQTSDTVFVDVVVTDQFGNRVGGEQVRLTDDSATGTIAESDGTAGDGTVVSDFAEEGDASLSSTTATDQTVTASWTTERTTYTGSGSATTTGTETLTGSYVVDWYAVDYAASDITLTADGSGPREIGEAVTMTYEALDQFGQPISDLFVSFTRSGPGAGSDTTGSSNTLTGADGRASYTFVGGSEGRADVTATARQGSATGEVVSAATRTASVTFEPEQVDPVRPDIDVDSKVKGRKVVLKVFVDASTQDPVVGEVKIREQGRLIGFKELRGGKRKFVFRNVATGQRKFKVVFLGNDLVEKRAQVVRVRVR